MSFPEALSGLLEQVTERSIAGRQNAAKNIRLFVERQSRVISSELFIQLMDELIKRRIFDLVNSADVDAKLGG
jgi:hypothetical protein